MKINHLYRQRKSSLPTKKIISADKDIPSPSTNEIISVDAGISFFLMDGYANLSDYKCCPLCKLIRSWILSRQDLYRSRGKLQLSTIKRPLQHPGGSDWNLRENIIESSSSSSSKLLCLIVNESI